MSEATYMIELTIAQVGMIQRSLRHAMLASQIDVVAPTDDDWLDLEHLRTHIAESVSMSSQSEQSGSKTSTP